MAYEGIPTIRQECWSRSRVPPKYRWAWEDIYAAIPGWIGAGGPYDLVNNLVGTPVGAVTYTNSYQGPEITFPSSTSVSFGNVPQFGAPLYGSITISVIHSPASTAVTAIWCYAGSNDGAGAPFCLVYSAGANSQYTFWNDNNGNGPSSTTTFAAGTRNLVIGRRTGDHAASPQLDLFVNGRLLGTSATTALDANWNSADTNYILSVNRFGGYNGYMGVGSMSNIMVWDRALSDAEIQLLSEDPYGPLRQLRQDYVFMFNAIAASQSVAPLAMAHYRRRRA